VTHSWPKFAAAQRHHFIENRTIPILSNLLIEAQRRLPQDIGVEHRADPDHEAPATVKKVGVATVPAAEAV